MSDELDDVPETPALDAWYERQDRGSDRPKTMLWYPREAPYVILQVTERGCQQPPVLSDPERPHVNVHLGVNVTIGGLLSDMEAYFAAVTDVLRVARWQADGIARQMAEEASTS